MVGSFKTEHLFCSTGRLARALGTVAALAAALTPIPALCQQVRVEVEIRNTASPSDDYLTWAPAPARIRLVPGGAPGSDVLVALTNDPQAPIPEGRQTPLDGDVVFAESVPPGQTAQQDTLTLSLPGNGSWRSFVVAGKFRRASTRDKDAIIEVHLGAQGGPLIHTHPVMVRIRKDSRELTSGERDRFLAAVADLHFTRQAYVPFVEVHDWAAKGKRLANTPQYWPDQSHRMAAFLPWHRAFLLQFERELQKNFPDVALPYWRLSEPSNVFTLEFLGANQTGSGEIVSAELTPDHPLAFWKIAGAPLMRFAIDRESPDELSQFTPEDKLLDPSISRYAIFRATVESNPHNNGHNWVGPWMQNCMVSPRDPIFWVFHTEFDRLWAKWQWKRGRFGTSGAIPEDYEPAGTYNSTISACEIPRPNQCIPLGHYLKDTMWPWNEQSGPGVNAGANRPPQQYGKFPASGVSGLWPAAPASPTPSDMIDYAGVDSTRLDMGFSYDDIPFGAAPSEPMPELLAAAELPSSREIRPLARVLKDAAQPDEIRATALRRLTAIDQVTAIDHALEILRGRTDGGAGLDAEAVELLHTQMMFTNEGLARHDEIHTALRNALTDPRRPVRVTAMRMLGPSGDPEAVRLLVESLAQPEKALFQPAETIRALTVAGIESHTAVVRPYLDHSDPEVRAAAVTALLGDPGSQARILQMLADRNETFEVRDAAIVSLAHGTREALPPVLDLLTDREADLRLRARAAAALVFWLRSPGITPQEKSIILERIQRSDRQDLEKIGPAAGKLLSHPGVS